MRMSFADLVCATGVNFHEEYSTLFGLISKPFYVLFTDRVFQGDSLFGDPGDDRNFFSICNAQFQYFSVQLRGTTRDIEGFNRYHNISLPHADPSLDELLFLIEYVYTFAYGLKGYVKTRNEYDADVIVLKYVTKHLNEVLARLHYEAIAEGAFVRLVPADVPSAVVAGRMKTPLSIKTFMYQHRSMRGNLTEKKSVLKLIGDELEPHRDVLKQFNSDLEKCIFTDLNAMDIRHNNTAPGSENYRPFFANKSPAEKEACYDRLYDMMIIAYMYLLSKDGIAENKRLLPEINAKMETLSEH